MIRVVKKLYTILILILGVLELFLLKSEEWFGACTSSLLLIMIAFLSLLDKRKDKLRQGDRNYNTYEMALNSLSVAVWEWNETNNKFSVSDNFKVILQRDRYITSLEDLYSVIYIDDKDYIKSFFKEMMNGKVQESFSLEFIVKNSKGNLITMECLVEER